MDDTLRSTIIARAETLGLTAYAISQQAELDPQTVKRYLSERCSLNSRYVSQICEVLGLELKPINQPRKKNQNGNCAKNNKRRSVVLDGRDRARTCTENRPD